MPTVYPVPGFFLQDVPSVEHECDDPRCVESGAFTKDKPPKQAEPQPEAPADAGALDSSVKE